MTSITINQDTATATDIQTAVPVDQETLASAYDLIATAVALGFPAPAIVGTTATEVTIYGQDYDDPDVSLGIYITKEAAVTALASFVLERHNEMEDLAPWADDIDDEAHTDAQAYDRAFEAARTAWLDGKTDHDIAASMFADDGYYFTHHKIEAAPARTW